MVIEETPAKPGAEPGKAPAVRRSRRGAGPAAAAPTEEAQKSSAADGRAAGVCVLCSSDAQPVLSLGPQSSVLHPPQYTRLATMPAGAAKEPSTSQTAKDTTANGGAAGHEQERGGGAQVGAVQAAAEEQPSAVSAEDAKALSAAYASLGDAALPYVPFTPLFSMLL